MEDKDGTKDNITVTLYWTEQPESGQAAKKETEHREVDGTTNLHKLDISSFTKGTYYVYLELESDKINAVNANYIIEVDSVSKLPTDQYSKTNPPSAAQAKQKFEVGDGTVNISGMKWTYTYLHEGTEVPAKEYIKNAPDANDNTKLVYTPLTATTAREYILKVNESSSEGFPATYLEIDKQAGGGHPVAAVSSAITVKGYTFIDGTGYTQFKYTDAGTYKTVVLLKIKDGNTETKFENKTGKGYTYIDDTHAFAEFEWAIEKFTVKPADYLGKGLEYGYRVEDIITQTKSDFAAFKKANDGTDENPVYVYEVDVQGGNMIIPEVQLPDAMDIAPFDLTAVLDPQNPTGDGMGAKRVTKVTEDGKTLTTTFTYKIKDAVKANYQLATSPDDKIVIIWRVTVATLSTSGWDTSGESTLTGEVLDKDGNKIIVTLPTPVITSDDDKAIAEKVEYVYIWDKEDGSTPVEYKGLQGLYDLNEEANALNGGAGGLLGGTVKVVVKAKDGYKLDSSLPESDFEQEIEIGDTKTRVSVTVNPDAFGGVYKNVSAELTVKQLNPDGTTDVLNPALYKRYIYKTSNAADISKAEKIELTAEELNKLDAGTWYVGIELVNNTLFKILPGQEFFSITVTALEIDVPEIAARIEFNSSTLSFADYLDAKYKEYLDAGIISAVSGTATARDVSSSPYVATIEIINANYKWKAPATAAPSKVLLKASIAEDEITTDVTLDGTQKIAEYGWNIAPFRLTADVLNLNGKNGAVFNEGKLPEWARQLIADGTLTVGVSYFSDEAGTTPLSDEEVVIKGGRQYFVKPVISGGDSGNFTFATDDSVINTPAKAVTYKVPQSGATAVLNNVKGFVTKTWLGLPVWAWMAIGLAVLILLIIIIAVAVKRSKNKAAREEKKAAKEAERARLESQREIEKMKAEAEAAKAKAQAEAEIAKIRAQAQAAMPQVQPAQAMPQMPQMPQAMPQQQPVQAMPDVRQYPQQANVVSRQYAPQPTADGGAIARIEAEIAAMRAEHRTEREFAAMRAEQRADRELNAMKTELEISKLRAEQRGYSSSQSDKSSFEQSLNNPDMLMIGQLAVAIWKSMKEGASLPSLQQQPAEQPDQTVKEEVSQPVSAAYPPDAVITTTTTVDTTRSAKTNLRGRDNQRDAAGFADIDGFYDSYEE